MDKLSIIEFGLILIYSTAFFLIYAPQYAPPVSIVGLFDLAIILVILISIKITSKNKKNNIKKPLLIHKFLLALLILEAVVLFVIAILFPSKMPPIYPFGIVLSFFQWSTGLFFVISLYVLTTYFLATHEKYILPFFIVGVIMLILNIPLFTIASQSLNSPLHDTLEIYMSSCLYVSSNLIMYSVFSPSLMLLVLKHLKVFEKQNALIKTMIITAMIFPLIMFADYSSYLIFSWLSFIF